MNPRRHPRTRSRLALGALVAVTAAPLLAGCGDGGDGGGADSPDGWTHVETGWLAVDVPEGWVETGRVNDRWTTGWQDAEGDDATVQLLASPTFGYYTADTGRGTVLAGAQVGGFPAFTVTDQSEPDGDPRTMTRTDFTYEPSEGEGVYDGILWVASDPDTQKAVAVQLTGTGIDPEIVEQVEASLTVLDTDAEPGS